MVKPTEILRHECPTKKFLCPLSANEYGIEFLSFVIQDYQLKKTIFEVSRDRPLPIDFSMHDAMDPDSLRKINYELSEDFLRLPNISTTLVFSVGQEPLTDFRMIERHYFRDQLIKSYDFSFGFCIPGSTNTWEAVYALPPMDNALIDDMIAHPYETSSDSFLKKNRAPAEARAAAPTASPFSRLFFFRARTRANPSPPSRRFYFVGEKLIMHNKVRPHPPRPPSPLPARSADERPDASARSQAYYKYIPEDSNAQCKSYETKYASAKGEKATAKADSKGGAGAKAEAKGAKPTAGAGAKAQAKGGGEDDGVWSKEGDYF